MPKSGFWKLVYLRA